MFEERNSLEPSFYHKEVENALLDKRFLRAQKLLNRPEAKDEIDRLSIRNVHKKSELETEQQKYRHKIATVFEAIVYEQAESSEWLGGDVFMFASSESSDVVKGVDLVARFNSGEDAQHLGLGIDVTTASDFSIIKKKLDRIFRDIDNDKITGINYIEEGSGENKEVEMPRVIVGTSVETVQILMKLWDQTISGDEEVRKEAKKSLANNSIQTKMLLEIEMQLDAFKKYADEKGKKKSSIYFTKTLLIIRNILKEKSELVEKHRFMIEKDPVFINIKDRIRQVEEVREYEREVA